MNNNYTNYNNNITINDIIDNYITEIQIKHMLDKSSSAKLLANVLSDKAIKSIINKRMLEIINNN